MSDRNGFRRSSAKKIRNLQRSVRRREKKIIRRSGKKKRRYGMENCRGNSLQMCLRLTSWDWRKYVRYNKCDKGNTEHDL